MSHLGTAQRRATPSSRSISAAQSDVWRRARVARNEERLAQAVAFYSRAMESDAGSRELYLEAAGCVLALRRRLAGIERLFARHRTSFGLEAGGAVSPDRLIGDALHWIAPSIAGDAPPVPWAPPQSEQSGKQLGFGHAYELLRGGVPNHGWANLARSIEAFYVLDIPTRYEFVGDYKVAYHGYRFYAVPRRVSEFTIIERTVYRVPDYARLRNRRIPPVLLWCGLRLRRYVFFLAERIAAVRWLGSRLRRVAMRLLRSRIGIGIARRITRLAWRRYAVKGVLDADHREELLALIDRRGASTSKPTAGEGSPATAAQAETR
jgi:hypothetical protein